MTIDHTPLDFNPINYRNSFTLKRQILDKYVYPFSTRLVDSYRRLRSQKICDFSFQVDRFLVGDRGSGFLALTDQLNSLVNISSANVLIQGCGLGQEALAWSEIGASSCTGIDLYNFTKGWNLIAEMAKPTKVNFRAADIGSTEIPSQNFDVISSFAVWEHIQDFPKLIKESKRLIKPDGVVMAAFGPLWYTFSGDHFSSAGGTVCGFNHLLLPRQEYLEWIDSFQQQHSWATSAESYFEIRNHIHDGLFSYLRPREYIKAIEKEFNCVNTIVIISPEAIAFRQEYPVKWQQLLAEESMLEEDLLIKGMVLFLSPKD